MRFSEIKPGLAFRMQDSQHPEANFLWVRSKLFPETALLVEEVEGTYKTDPLKRRVWPEDVEVTSADLPPFSAQEAEND